MFESREALDEHVATLAALPPLALAGIKRAVYEGIQRPLDDGLALERELIEQLFRSEDAHEGLRAFIEKRTPDSRAHEHQPIATLKRGVFIGGEPSADRRGDRSTVTNPATGSAFARVPTRRRGATSTRR